MCSEIKAGSGEELRTLVDQALAPYFPYDRAHKSATYEQVTLAGVQHKILLVKLWSRYLAQAIELRVGSREACQVPLGSLQRDKTEGVDFVICEVDPRDKLIGIVEVYPSRTIDETPLAQSEHDE